MGVVLMNKQQWKAIYDFSNKLTVKVIGNVYDNKNLLEREV